MRTTRVLCLVLIGGAMSFTGVYAGSVRTDGEMVSVYVESTDNNEDDPDDYARKKYPGCRILDRDTDDGFVEVKINHRGIEKIMLFDGGTHWLHTLWEVRRNQLPDKVVTALRREGFAYSRIDDNDNQALDTPWGRCYAVQVDGDGRDGMYVVTSLGKILRRYSHDRWNDGRIYSGDWRTGGRDDGEDRFDGGDDEWDDRRGIRHCCDDGEDRFDEGDDEWDDRRGIRHCCDDGEDRFDEGDDEWDDRRGNRRFHDDED